MAVSVQNCSRTMLFLVFGILLATVASASPSVQINELMAINDNFDVEDNGKSPDWFELYNYGEDSVDLKEFYVSDTKNNMIKFQIQEEVIIPPKGYHVLVADGKKGYNHVGFKLGGDGEELLLTAPDGETIIDSVDFPKQVADVSYGRSMDGGIWGFLEEATPGEGNSAVLKLSESDEPFLSHKAGFYDEAIELKVSSVGNVYYTTDGTTPKQKEEDLYTEPIVIDETTTIRIMVVEEGSLPSKVVTRTYFINEEFTLPVVSFVSNPDNFFNENDGLFKQWSEEEAETVEPEEHALHMEYFDDASLEFKMTVDAKTHGFHSKIDPGPIPRAFRIYAREKYGQDRIEYPLFGEASLPSYKRVVFRPASEDKISNSGTHFRDPLVHSIAENMAVDTQAYSPVIVFINGEYWGIYNIRERLDKYYVSDHYGVEPEEVKIAEGQAPLMGPTEVNPTEEDYEKWIKEKKNQAAVEYGSLFLEITNMKSDSPEFVTFVESSLDVDSLFDWHALQLYSHNNDWVHNSKRWKASGLWKFMVFDTDSSFGLHSIGIDKNNLDHFLKTPKEGNYYTSIFPTIMKNDALRERFLVRFADLLNSDFREETVDKKIDFFVELLEPEVGKHIAKWIPEDSGNWLWTNSVEELRQYVDGRTEELYGFFDEYFEEIDGTHPVSVGVECGGEVHVNSIIVQDGFEGDVFNILQFTPKNFETEDFTSIKIQSKIDKLWLQEKGLVKDDVSMFRHITEWVELPTTILEEDGSFVYYESQTPGFSYFIIGSKERVESLEGEEEEATADEERVEEDVVNVVKKAYVYEPWQGLVAFVILITIVFLVAYNKRRK